MTLDSVVVGAKSERKQKTEKGGRRYCRPATAEKPSGAAAELSWEALQGANYESVQPRSSRRFQQSGNATSHAVCRDRGHKLQHNQSMGVASGLPRNVYGSRQRTPSAYFAGPRSGTTPMPAVLPLPPQHWLSNHTAPIQCSQPVILNEPSEGELRCIGMTMEIKTLLRMQ